MNAKVFMVIRILFGLFILFFGLNKFFHFIPDFELDEGGQKYYAALTSAKVLPYLAGIVEVLAGISFLVNKWGALMAVILMSVAVNAVLFHLNLDMANIAGAAIFLTLNILTLVGYRDRYAAILKP